MAVESERMAAMDTDKKPQGFKEVSRKRKKEKDMDTGEETAAKRPAFPPVDDTTSLVSTHTQTPHISHSHKYPTPHTHTLTHTCRVVKENSDVSLCPLVDSHLSRKTGWKYSLQ